MSPNYQSEVSSLFYYYLLPQRGAYTMQNPPCSKNAFWEESDYLADCTVRDAMVGPRCFRSFRLAPLVQAPELRARLVCGAPLFASSSCLANALDERTNTCICMFKL